MSNRAEEFEQAAEVLRVLAEGSGSADAPMGHADIMVLLRRPQAATELARSYMYGQEGGDIKLVTALLDAPALPLAEGFFPDGQAERGSSSAR